MRGCHGIDGRAPSGFPERERSVQTAWGHQRRQGGGDSADPSVCHAGTTSEQFGSAPPGYIGYEEGGQLSESVRRRPYSVVLLDEVEKAHPDVFNILLQVLDDGRITDAQGRTVDFRNTVIVMTSNIGSEHILDLAGDDAKYDKMQQRVMEALRSHFRPEFLNRVDDIIIFHTLSRNELGKIIRIQLQRVENLLAEQKISLEITSAACNYLVEVGYDPVYGARPIKRALQREVENPIATKLLENTFVLGDTIVIDQGEQGLTFTKKNILKVSPLQNTATYLIEASREV